MAGVEEANGHRPVGLSHVLDPSLAAATRPDPAALGFDLDSALESVMSLQARAPDDAFSSSYLGTEREGNAVVIDESGLALTIGYLIAESETVMLGRMDGRVAPAHAVAYDYKTGFGLVRAAQPLGVKPIALGSSAGVAEDSTLIVAARGGRGQAINGRVVSKREFAGYWEYMLDEAIFTTPPHPHWSGAALIDRGGRLVGIGSLFVQDAVEGAESKPGNMFVPIDLFRAVHDDLITHGRSPGPPRPWLGLYSVEALGRVLVTSVSDDGPADRAGVEAGDVVLSVNGTKIGSIARMYRELWSTGAAGVVVELGLMRDDARIRVDVETADRESFMKRPRAH